MRLRNSPVPGIPRFPLMPYLFAKGVNSSDAPSYTILVYISPKIGFSPTAHFILCSRYNRKNTNCRTCRAIGGRYCFAASMRRGRDMLDSRPTVVDLFAGAGLFSHCFRASGCRIIRAIEIDLVAAETYGRNVGPQIEVGDVSRLQPSGRCDILISGPPCQGFSTLGARRGDDPRNSLCLEVARWAKSMRPKVVVIENVAAFLESDEWERLRRRLKGLDYEVPAFVLDAFDHGVPQLRRRSFTVAYCEGTFILPPQRRTVRTVRQAWEGLPAEPNGENHHYSPKPSKVALARMRVIPPGGDKRDVIREPPVWPRRRGGKSHAK